MSALNSFCVLIGTICTAGFYVIGINYALLLGIVAGVLSLFHFSDL
jgi:predicted PurR-regulated permease PerM